MDENMIKFALRKITTEQFAINEEGYKETAQVVLRTNYRFGYHIENRVIASCANFKFEIEQVPFLLIEVVCHFELEEEAWNRMIHPQDETTELRLPKDIATHFLLLTIGTARGVLHAKTENTKYNQYFLPTLNINEVIEEDVVMSF